MNTSSCLAKKKKKKNSSEELRGLWRQKKAKGLSILRDAKPKHLQLRKRKVQQAQKSQGALDPKEYEAKTLWLTKTKEAAKSTYVYG